ncbi:hypothetical protein KC727_01340 [Candidatus Kaiserbacteria bacterium]|nr:hypothetical protein [Candidatus Kaiserbacteria bacterium]
MRLEFIYSSIIAGILTGTSLCSLSSVAAQVMQSASYQIQSDSINVGGGLSSSSNFELESTAGELATGESSSSNYELKAGYQQMQEVFLALTGATAVSLSPTLPGVTGGTANGSTTVTVITDSPSGYQLTIKAEGSPAMQKGADTIADYTPSGDPDFTFTTGATDSHFGYSPEGVDVVQRFLDNGTDTCNTGSAETAGACWDGLTTSAVAIASNTDANHPLGATTTVTFRVGIGGSVLQPPGTYTATTTLTALPL